MDSNINDNLRVVTVSSNYPYATKNMAAGL